MSEQPSQSSSAGSLPLNSAGMHEERLFYGRTRARTATCLEELLKHN
jgi:hypothetical protein